MRLFHISDLHIGKSLHGFNMKEDQEYILNEIINQMEQKQPQVLMITGDIYDKPVPSAEAVLIFDNFLSCISEKFNKTKVLIIAGNHDSAERTSYASSILAHQKIYICGVPPKTQNECIMKVVSEDEYGTVDFYLLPFVKPSQVNKVFEEKCLSYDDAVKNLIQRENIDYSKRNVILSHQFFVPANGQVEKSDSEAIVVGGIDNVFSNCLLNFDYAALGHIHKPQNVGEDYIRYAGTPLKYSASEHNHNKSITMIDLKQKGNISFELLPLVPLRDLMVIKGKLKDIIDNYDDKHKNDYVSITITDNEKLYKPKETCEYYYNNIIEFKIDNPSIRKEIYDNNEEIKLDNPLKAFSDFYLNVNGVDMTKEEINMMISVFNEVEK